MALPQTLAEFTDLLVRSELVGPAALELYRSSLLARGPLPEAARDFAAVAIRDGVLTPFQARLLLQGRWKNFFLGGKYKVLEHLGSGGMGTVFLCEHRHMRRRVAVKLLPPDPNDPERAVRFQREAQAIARLDHPNIVRAFDTDRENDVHFLVMEYIDGVSLQDLVDSRGPLTIPRAVNYLAQAACGLQHAAAMGLVHRDVKPSNLMLDWAGAVKVLDLGLARFSRVGDPLASRAGQNPTVLGTADYLAPEQAQGSAVDARADIYSLGAVAYFLFAGRPPFDGGTVAQKLVRHQSEVPVGLNERRDDLPPALAAVVGRMLAKHPDERPPTGTAVVEAMRPWLVDVPSPTTEEMPPTRYAAHRDVDTRAHLLTAAIVSKSSRSLLLNTMLAPVCPT